MNIVLIVVAVAIVSASFISTRITSPEESEVLSEVTSTPFTSATPTIVETEPPTNTSTPTPVVTDSPEPMATSTPTPSASSNTSGWIYPSSSVISQGDSTILESSDSTDKITDWYKNKIESEGFNVRSSVKTSANDKIKNVISAANGNTNVQVEITKNPEDDKARIEVKITSS